MSTREWYSRARYWTYSLTYGQELGMRRSTSNNTDGSDFVERSWKRLVSWWVTMVVSLAYLLAILWERMDALVWTIRQSSSQRFNTVARRYRHIGRHRSPLGRNTRTARRRMRLQTSVAMENKRQFAELMTSQTDPTLIGEAWMENPIDVPRVYRRLSTPRLRLEANTQTLIRPKVKEWDPYDEVP